MHGIVDISAACENIVIVTFTKSSRRGWVYRAWSSSILDEHEHNTQVRAKFSSSAGFTFSHLCMAGTEYGRINCYFLFMSSSSSSTIFVVNATEYNEWTGKVVFDELNVFVVLWCNICWVVGDGVLRQEDYVRMLLILNRSERNTEDALQIPVECSYLWQQ